MAEGKLAVVSGFSGVGKGTLVKLLLERYDDYVLSVSATTRKPRQGEVDGVDYFFITKEAFEEGIEKGEFLEYNYYVGNYYGTPKPWVMEQIAKGKNVIFEIEMHGGLNVKKVYPEARLIFVTAPDMEEVANRLRGRGTETEEQIEARLRQAEEEKEFIKDYDYVLVNDDLETSVIELDRLIRS